MSTETPDVSSENFAQRVMNGFNELASTVSSSVQSFASEVKELGTKAISQISTKGSDVINFTAKTYKENSKAVNIAAGALAFVGVAYGAYAMRDQIPGLSSKAAPTSGSAQPQ